MVDSINQTIETQVSQMNSQIKVWQLVLSILPLLGLMIGIYVNNQVTISNHETRIQSLEYQNKAYGEDLKEIKKQNTEILILLQNKQDRRK